MKSQPLSSLSRCTPARGALRLFAVLLLAPLAPGAWADVTIPIPGTSASPSALANPVNATVSAATMFPNPDPNQDYSGPFDGDLLAIPYNCPILGYKVYYFDSVTTDTTTGFIAASGEPLPAPSLAPGEGFFFLAENGLGPTTVTVTGPAGTATPLPCSCGTFSQLGNVTATTGPAYDSVVGSPPVNGSGLMVWSGSTWLQYFYSCSGWLEYAGGTWTSAPAPTVAPGTSVQVLVPCSSSPAAPQVFIYGPAHVGSGGVSFVLVVVNLGPSTSSSATLQVDGIPNTMTLTPPVGSTPVSGATQGFQVTVPALPCGQSVSYSFSLAPGSASSGTTFTMNGTFTTVYTSSGVAAVSVVESVDPNDKEGPLGLGTPHYLTGNPPLPYAITFENLPSATAPAQRVVVTDKLDLTTMMPGTFELGPITFGSQVVTPPPGVNAYSNTVPYPAQSVNVQITAALDLNALGSTYGTVTWTFQSLDPNTGQPPSNPLVGFLPPNTAPPQGQGMVTYTVNSLPSLVTGNLITNSATVVFDANAAISTATWTNTVLTTIPSLTIQRAMPGQVRITWPSWTLVESSLLSGPWTNSTVQVSPWTFTPGEPAKFYRLQAP